MYYAIPQDPSKAQPILQRFMQENEAVAAGAISARRRPQPPRSLLVQPASQGVLLSWMPPQNMNGILGFNVYQNNELNRILSINDPKVRQALMKVEASSNHAFYVSTYNALQESVKVMVQGASSTDLYVVAGTSGGTGGIVPTVPPGYYPGGPP